MLQPKEDICRSFSASLTCEVLDSQQAMRLRILCTDASYCYQASCLTTECTQQVHNRLIMVLMGVLQG